MRPAEVCGCVRRPSDSRAASSARIVELLASITSARALLPTGMPVEIYSSSVLISISCCLTEIAMVKILPRWQFSSARCSQCSDPQGGEERFLRYLHAPDLLHAAFALFLLFEELALAGDVPTVALRRHVLAVGAHRLAGNDPLPHRRLHRHLELLAWY